MKLKKYIPRPLYVAKIRPFVGKSIIKVLTGQRRVGKSYILIQLIDEILKENPEANIIFVDKELQEFSDVRDSEQLYRFVTAQLKEGANYLFIDEVQEIASFELALRSLLNEEKCDIFCTGSNAKMLSGELATTLGGRYIEFPVHSLSYREFLEFHRIEDSNHHLVKYLTLGGMPYQVHLGLDEQVIFEYLKSIYSTILLRDVVARESIRNVSFLENLVAFLADNTGSLFSAQNISKYLKSQQINIPTQTILSYLRALANAYFIHKVQRADVNGLKIFEIGEKYYFEDLGLRNAVRRFDFRSDVNKLMENVVYMHLRRMGYTVYVGKKENKEIDFIADRNGERLYVQVAYMLLDQTTIDREFGNLMEIEDHYPKLVVTMDELPVSGSYFGIRQVHLREFLLGSTS